MEHRIGITNVALDHISPSHAFKLFYIEIRKQQAEENNSTKNLSKMELRIAVDNDALNIYRITIHSVEFLCIEGRKQESLEHY